MSVFEMRAQGVSLAVDLTVGHLADLAFDAEGRVVRPLHRAPWVGTGGSLPPGLPENVVRLSGDFFCAPFSRNDVEEGPPHGWPANSAWDVVADDPLPGGRQARLRLRRTVMGATVDKVLTLRDGHPFLYQEHVLSGGGGAVPVAHHTMVRMTAGGRILFSPKRAALTPEIPLEADPARGRSIFAYPARTGDIARLPLADGSTADLTRYPPGTAHEDFVTLVEAGHDGPGFAAVARKAEDDLVLVLKNARRLPVTMLWFSNGGRDYAPWNGRHVGVLGIEDGISAVGHRESLGDNPVRREGVPTALDLDPAGAVPVRQVIGWSSGGAAPTAVRVDASAGVLVVEREGGTVRLPYDAAFLDPAPEGA